VESLQPWLSESIVTQPWVKPSVATDGFFSVDLGFFCFIWGSGGFIENMGFLTLAKF